MEAGGKDMDCYIYYQTAEEHGPEVLAQLRKIQQSLARKMDVRLQLQRRQEVTEGLLTWMEIYREIPIGFDACLSGILDQSSLIPLIHGKRHAEYFEDAISCA
jgi:hypothetical protein